MQNISQYLLALTFGAMVPFMLVLLTHVWVVLAQTYELSILPALPKLVAVTQVAMGFL